MKQIRRTKIYYPESQVRTGLYTSGTEYMTLDKKEYVGQYHIYPDGQIYSGMRFDSIKSRPLISFDNNQFRLTYKIIVKRDLPESIVINTYTPVITEDQYRAGVFNRYFAQKINDNNVIEISSDTFDDIMNKSSSTSLLYKVVNLIWRIAGPLEQLIKNEILLDLGVIESNRRSIVAGSSTIKNLSYHIIDYMKFWKSA